MSSEARKAYLDAIARECAMNEGRDESAAAQQSPVRRRGRVNSDKGAASPQEERCEGVAPEGSSGAATAAKGNPANATQARPLTKLDLSTAPSGMETAAAKWSSPVAYGERIRAREASEAAAGRVFCRCGGKGSEGGYVPQWFGRDCIEKDCALRGLKASIAGGARQKHG